MTTNVEQFNQTGVLCIARTTRWGMTAPLREEDIGAHIDEKTRGVVQLGFKRLMPREVVKRLNGDISNGLLRIQDRYAKFPGVKNAFFLPWDKFNTVNEELEELRHKQQMNVIEFARSEYPRLREEMIREFPFLEGANWIEPGAIVGKYSLTWRFVQLGTGNDVPTGTLSPEQAARVRDQIAADLEASIAEFKVHMLEEAKGKFFEQIERLTRRLADGKPTQLSIEAPLRALEKIADLSGLFADETLTGAIERLKSTVNVSADGMRGNARALADFGNAIERNVSDISAAIDAAKISADGASVRRIDWTDAEAA